jgi:hypothetical protein
MIPTITSGVVFACVFVFALAAMFGRRALPESHLSGDAKDFVKLGLGTVATLAALVLGLLIATAKGAYDTQNGAVQEFAAKVLLLDRILEKYGPETKKARDLLGTVVEESVNHLWPVEGAGPANLAPGEARAAGDALYDQIAGLKPAPEDDGRRALKARALEVLTNLFQDRFRLFARQDSALPTLFLVVLAFWLVILFAGYGLLAPGNATAVAVLLVCALSVAGAMFLMLELTSPFAGLLRVSSGPLRDALAAIGK